MGNSTTLWTCESCGAADHVDLMDCKPQPGQDPDCGDWDRVECARCYGPGWLPADEGAYARSVNPGLASTYAFKRATLPWQAQLL